jgi:AmmeMemoRadiSam system protein A
MRHGIQNRQQWTPGPEHREGFPDGPVATFVTLHVQAQLNGCIGTIEPRRPICEDIAYNAYQAAFHDPRFGPLTELELDEVEVHISVLSPLELIDVAGEFELIECLEPGRDGLVLEAGARRATFLPSVWDKLDSPREFVGHLKRKARIGPLEWPESMQVFRYRVLEFSG